MKLTIEEYAQKYKMSKEMIYSKIRSNKLNYINEDGTLYIVVPDETPQQSPKEQPKKLTVATLIELYKKENQALKERVAYLEAKVDKLIDDKEKMLREEKERIEQIYAAKDEQLKTILELLSTKLQLQQQEATPHHYEPLPPTQQLIELKEYLKSLDLEPEERKKIKKRFNEVKGADIRVQEQNGKIYLNLSKYDYTDLLSL